MDYREIRVWNKIPQLKKLLDLSTPPKNLYFKGPWDPKIFENCAAVVGSRRMTDYGGRAVEKVIPRIVAQGKTVISGFMYGVDQYAHQVCLENGGKTIAVLGWGIDKKLTGEDQKLAAKIIAGGGILLSEWISQQPTHWTFPVRNRIVAALSSEVIVIEAALQSGSLITARIASKLKRGVWALPGPITSKASAGTNQLIANGHAKIWLGADTSGVSFGSPEVAKADNPILQILDMEALTADELARKLSQEVAEVGAKLSILLVSGAILEKGGKYYISDNC